MLSVIDCIYISLFSSMEMSLQLVLTCKFRTILIRLEVGDFFFSCPQVTQQSGISLTGGDFMANGSTPFASAEIKGLFKQPAHSLYLLQTYVGGSRRLKSHVIILHCGTVEFIKFY